MDDRRPALLLYDGTCGFCHAWVQRVLAADVGGRQFRFAPLQGETAAARLSEAQRSEVGDSMVVITPEGAILSRSTAALYVGRQIGGWWGLFAGVAGLVPAALRDASYDAVARIRHRLAAKPKEVCPILPPDLRRRFDP
jgi:predicted DCC family thiol-disulfide oxidoreductase YuxK